MFSKTWPENYIVYNARISDHTHEATAMGSLSVYGTAVRDCGLLVSLSLRNLVSGYECGRVFPAGVGPGPPSRDAANWLPSRFACRLRRGGGMVG